jgi:inosine-uridine nucleoside N-ribohydrolase
MKRRYRLVLAAALILALGIGTLAMPVRIWRTGEIPVPSLPLQPGDAFAVNSARLWIDTDIACGTGERVDPDDCLALLLLVRAAGGRIAGVSLVAGNGSAEVVESVARQFREVLGPTTPLFFNPRAARGALQSALEQGALTIVALGPLTNVAAALEGRPDLQARLSGIVAVMGRRQGHLFHPSEGKGGGMLLGHGPVFTDFNYEQDREAAARVMQMGLPLVMVPYEAARSVQFGAADLDRLAAGGAAGAWVARRSRAWLEFWQQDVGLPGFYPFDLVGAAFVLAPGQFRCAKASLWVAPTRRFFAWLGFPESLSVGLAREKPREMRVDGEAVYCPRLAGGMHAWLMQRLQ